MLQMRDPVTPNPDNKTIILRQLTTEPAINQTRMQSEPGSTRPFLIDSPKAALVVLAFDSEILLNEPENLLCAPHALE